MRHEASELRGFQGPVIKQCVAYTLSSHDSVEEGQRHRAQGYSFFKSSNFPSLLLIFSDYSVFLCRAPLLESAVGEGTVKIKA